MDVNLEGKNALVFGASKGIGAAGLKQLAAMNANVIGLARSQDDLENTLSACGGTGSKKGVCADVSDHADLTKKLEEVLGTHKQIHIVVNNSGGPPPGPIAEATPEAFMAAFQNHLLTCSLGARIFLPGMKEAGYGRFVNVISTSVKAPIPNLGVSNTIRGAVASWAKTLASEVAPFGITVNNVLPGFTDTARLGQLKANVASRRGITEEEVYQEWMNAIPARRLAQPEETAYAIGFLASPAASYINGINLPVDGGRTVCL